MDNIKPLNIIVAVEETGGFGNNGTIPWRDEKFAKEDFKHFQSITKGSVCIMGRKTYDEILEMTLKRKSREDIDSILPGRICYVISRNQELEVVGATVVPSLRAAREIHNDDDKEIFVIGGERLFTEALTWTQTIYLTVIKNTYECDRFFNLKYLDHFFAITDGNQTDNLYFLTYKRTKR